MVEMQREVDLSFLNQKETFNTLIDYRYQQHFKAKRGGDGRGKTKQRW